MFSLGVICMIIVSLEFIGFGLYVLYLTTKEVWLIANYRLDSTDIIEMLLIIMAIAVGFASLYGGFKIFPYTFALSSGITI